MLHWIPKPFTRGPFVNIVPYKKNDLSKRTFNIMPLLIITRDKKIKKLHCKLKGASREYFNSASRAEIVLVNFTISCCTIFKMGSQ
jgi:hypothetical protein